MHPLKKAEKRLSFSAVLIPRHWLVGCISPTKQCRASSRTAPYRARLLCDQPEETDHTGCHGWQPAQKPSSAEKHFTDPPDGYRMAPEGWRPIRPMVTE